VSAPRRRVTFPRTELPPGERKVLTVGRREIVVLNTGDRLYAVFNRCPHQLAHLHRGVLRGTTVPAGVGEFVYGLEDRVLRCPWHHYEYDLETGRCLAEPDRLRISTYEVREEGDEIALYV
jgi:nitrite reductase/ring-hydroxylating ferredoxin subunit